MRDIFIIAGPEFLIGRPQGGAPEVFGRPSSPSSPLSISRILSQLRVQIEFRLLNRPPVIPGRIETPVGADLAILPVYCAIIHLFYGFPPADVIVVEPFSNKFDASLMPNHLAEFVLRQPGLHCRHACALTDLVQCSIHTWVRPGILT